MVLFAVQTGNERYIVINLLFLKNVDSVSVFLLWVSSSGSQNKSHSIAIISKKPSVSPRAFSVVEKCEFGQRKPPVTDLLSASFGYSGTLP